MKTKQEVVALLVPLLQGYIDNPETLGYDPVLKRCVYLGKNGKGDTVKCIFGSCLTDEFLNENSGSMEGKSAKPIIDREEEKGDRELMFKEEYKNISSGIWQNAQQVHDGMAPESISTLLPTKIDALMLIINISTHPGNYITDLGLKFPEVAVN